MGADDALSFLSGGGTMGALMRVHDWGATPLGPPEAWPQSLRSVLSACLNSPLLGAVLWGPELRMLYNDAYIPSMADRHPNALGRPVSEVWGSAWDQVSLPFLRAMTTGEGFADRSVELAIVRRGVPQTTFWDFSAAPIRGEDGRIVGLLNQGTEITEQVLAGRRLAAERGRFAQLFEQAPTFMALLDGPDHRFVLANPGYFRLTGHRDLLGRTVAEALPEAVQQGYLDLLDRVYRSGKPFAADGYRLAMQAEPGGPVDERYVDFVYQPIVDAAGNVTGIFVEGVDVTARAHADAALRRSEARHRQILDSAIDYAIIATDLEGRVTRWNEGARRVLGWTEDEMLGQKADRLFTPEDVAAGQVQAEMRAALETGYGTDERWHLRKGGERFWAVGELTVLRDDSDAAVGFVKVLRDRTTARRTAEQLREAQSINALVLNSSRDCIVVLDLEGNTLFVSAGGIEAMDIANVDAILGLSWLRVWKGADHDAARQAVSDARAGGVGRFQGFCPTHKDRPKWWDIVISPLPGSDGKPGRLVSVGRDITEQKQAESALRALNDELERRVGERTRERDRVWRNSQDLLVVIDLRGTFRSVNPAVTTILGWTPDELHGRTVFDFMHPDDQPPRTDGLIDPARYRLARVFVNRYRHRDGRYRWLSWVATAEDDLIYAYGRDITAERAQAEALGKAEEQLRQAQKMEAVGQLTGGVAHDFNNLLTVIRSSIDLLKRPNLTEDRRQRYIEAISDTTTRASRLTGQLLAFARRQALKPEVFDVARSVRSIGEMVGTLTGSRITIRTDVPDQPCFVSADSSQFDTSLVNLAVNARDAMNGEGTLTIAVRTAAEIPPLRAHPVIPGDYVTVAMSDTGSGIAAGDLERIFEPFFTTKGVGQGTGLGLSQVFGFVKQSGGEVGVESEPGGGTTFTLYLPRVAAPSSTADHQDDQQPSIDGQGTRVLVVEDNVEVGSFATQTLDELGYQPLLAPDAETALAELTRDAGRFDIVFSDVVMPGMSGIDLAKEIRRRHRNLPVVLTSGYSHVLAQDGTFGFELLHKPYSIEQLSRVLQKAAHWGRLKRALQD